MHLRLKPATHLVILFADHGHKPKLKLPHHIHQVIFVDHSNQCLKSGVSLTEVQENRGVVFFPSTKEMGDIKKMIFSTLGAIHYYFTRLTKNCLSKFQR